MMCHWLRHETHNSPWDLFVDNISATLENGTLEERAENSEERAFLALLAFVPGSRPSSLRNERSQAA
jgi:hypothetical protein